MKSLQNHLSQMEKVLKCLPNLCSLGSKVTVDQLWNKVLLVRIPRQLCLFMSLKEREIAGFCDDLSLAFCKLLVALGDHSSSFLATHLPDPHVQTHLKLILNYTGFPGWYSIDEEVSEVRPLRPAFPIRFEAYFKP
jgi:hypothetical protein